MANNSRADQREIIFITRILSTGGAERVISELASEWIRQGVKVTIVQMEPRKSEDDYGISPEIEIINFNNEGKGWLGKRIAEVRGLRALLRQRPGAVAISFVFSANYVLGFTRLLVRNRVILSERNDPNAMSRLKRFLQVTSFRIADTCVFQTRDAMNFYPASVQKKGVIIPNPINPSLPDRFEGPRRRVIVTASRLDPQKNLRMLIDAFHAFDQAHPGYQLLIYGRAHMPGDTESQLKEQVRRLGLEDRVLFKGFATNLHEEIRDAAMYVCSSDYEGISNSVLEALALGIPTISTDCPIGGAREMIQDGVNGLLVPVGDSAAMARAMGRLAEDEAFRERIGAEGYRIREKYPVEAVAKKWLELV